MKNTVLVIALLLFGMNAWAQKKEASVFTMQSNGTSLSNVQATNLMMYELQKTSKYVVSEKNDVIQQLKQNGINYDDCFTKDCLSRAGKQAKVDYIFNGNLDKVGNKLIVTIRIFDVASGKYINQHLGEYLYVENEVQTVIGLTLHRLLEMEYDTQVAEMYDYEAYAKREMINADLKQMRLNGPRFGLSVVYGDVATVLESPRDIGGYDVSPYMPQIGYQHEFRYLNAGSAQALFEFVFMGSGFGQGMFIPSLSVMNGIRTTKGNWEFAFGPVLRVTKMAEGYFDQDKNWHLANEQVGLPSDSQFPVVRRVDSRGDITMTTSWVWAIGKTFTSGSLNIPVNVYWAPGKDGGNFGISMGYNISK